MDVIVLLSSSLLQSHEALLGEMCPSDIAHTEVDQDDSARQTKASEFGNCSCHTNGRDPIVSSLHTSIIL